MVRAPGSGDDTIVDLVATEGDGRRVVVVTADRELRDRVTVARRGDPRPVRHPALTVIGRLRLRQGKFAKGVAGHGRPTGAASGALR